jgi:hypothetical protein
MNYLKCVFAGLLFVAVAAILVPLGLMVCIAIFAHVPRGQSIGIDFGSLAKSHWLWILAALLFALGYALEARRIASH